MLILVEGDVFRVVFRGLGTTVDVLVRRFSINYT